MLEVDHLVLCVGDLVSAGSALAQRGLISQPGGRHPGHGTANRIVPLGDSYLELAAVVDADEARSSAFGAWVERSSEGPLGVNAVCLRTDDIDSVCRLLGLTPIAMSRVRPNGMELAWKLAGIELAIEESLPFFIQWEVPGEDLPGRTSVDHPVGPVSLEEVVVSGDSDKLGRWVFGASRVAVVEGGRGMTASLSTARGTLTL